MLLCSMHVVMCESELVCGRRMENWTCSVWHVLPPATEREFNSTKWPVQTQICCFRRSLRVRL